jgi:hypothetical protein
VVSSEEMIAAVTEIECTRVMLWSRLDVVGREWSAAVAEEIECEIIHY